MSKANDILVKCTRCRNVHMESQRVSKKNLQHGWDDLRCPRCGCNSFYNMQPQVAWCWRSGEIQTGDAMPLNNSDGSGAIKIAEGPKSELELMLNVLARSSRTHPGWLVPGVPEAEDGDIAIDALIEWIDRCATPKSKSWPGVKFEVPA